MSDPSVPGIDRMTPWWRKAWSERIRDRGFQIPLAVAVLGLAISLAVALGDEPQERTSAADLAVGEGPRLPARQREFLAIVARGQAEVDGASDVKVVNERRVRGEAFCALLPPALRAKDWRGVVHSLETVSAGDDADLSVWIAEDVELTTAGGFLGRSGVAPDDPLYDAVADLEEGDPIVFSGRFVPGEHCLEETSTLDRSQMNTPDFSFRFTSVEAAAPDS